MSRIFFMIFDSTERKDDTVRKWFDFAAVKAATRFESILEHYDLRLRQQRSELVGRCPFHEDRKASFSVNVDKDVFHCFGCGAKGNVLDFVARKEGVSVRKAAELICDWLGIEDAQTTERPKARRSEKATVPKTAAGTSGVDSSADEEKPDNGARNEPLAFKLKLEPGHPYLATRGVGEGIAEHFGIGFCSRGLLKGRIAIPIRDERGELVGYIGRWPGDDPPEGEERYKLPPGFKKARVVYNLDRVLDAEHLVVVEGVWSVFRLHALDVPAVALLGRTVSKAQEELLATCGASRFTLLMDGDEPGRDAAREIAPRLAQHAFVRVVKLPDRAQPDTVDEEVLRDLLD